MDLKADVPRTQDGGYDAREMAKDVAAFANASGGVILVGGCEVRGTLSLYKAVPRAEVPRIKDTYEMAVRDHCSPVPIVDVVPIPLTDGSGSVVAVNVLPFPGAVVGVLWGKGGVPTFSFPLRVASQTKWLRPEQIPMLTIPDLRRKIILLDAIPADERSKVDLVERRGDQPRMSKPRHVSLDSIDPLGGSVTVSERGASGDTMSFTIPVDAIDLVWKSRGRWLISFRGQLDSGEFLPRW